MASVSAGTQQAPERAIVKVALASLAGSSIEWYDFFIFGTAAALVFPDVVLPGRDCPTSGRPARRLQYHSPSRFLARPVGGIVFGPLRRPGGAQEGAGR